MSVSTTSIRVHGNHDSGYRAKINTDPNEPAEPVNMDHTDNVCNSQAVAWINKHEDVYQPALSELLGKIKRVSFGKFASQLETSTRDAVSQFGVNSRSAYRNFLSRAVVLVENKKSNQWVAELARKRLGFDPSSYYRLGVKDARDFVDHITNYASSSEKSSLEGKVVVLFDDGSYSGKQITEHVAALLELKNKRVLDFDKVCVIVPYMTTHAKTRLDQTVARTKNTADVIIGSYKRIKTVAESVSEENSRLLTKLWWGKEDPITEGPHSKGVIWFDHKIPNDQSFIGAIEKGNVVNTTNICKTLFKLIPDVKVPYKG